jgi:methylmalonyl-CoA mutase
MRPDFSQIDYKPSPEQANAPAHTVPDPANEWLSTEHIPIKGFYTREDLQGLEHLD